MKVLTRAVRISAFTLGTTVKTAVALSRFLVGKVIGAGGSVTIQSLLLASNAVFLYAGAPQQVCFVTWAPLDLTTEHSICSYAASK